MTAPLPDLHSPFNAGRRLQPVDADRLAAIFKALGAAPRWLIIALLAERYYRSEWDPKVRASVTVADVTSAIGLAQSTTSGHLAVLEQAGLVRADGDGRTIVPEAMAQLAGLIDPHGRYGAGQRPSVTGDDGLLSAAHSGTDIPHSAEVSA